MKKIELSKEEHANALTLIKNYYLNEKDEQIGDLQAMLLLDFFMETIGKTIYNQGVEDSKRFMESRLEDIYEIYA